MRAARVRIFSGLSSPSVVLNSDELWHDFFSDPSQWWDNRLKKKENPNFPDFRRKGSKHALWIDDRNNPPWVKAKMATLIGGHGYDKESGGGPSSLGSVRFADTSSDVVAKLCDEGRWKEAVEMVGRSNFPFSISAYVRLLKECAGMARTRKKSGLLEGKRIHGHVLFFTRGLESNLLLGNTLINMYAKCGGLRLARTVFDEMPKRNVFSWTMMILAYANEGQGEEALALFRRMHKESVKPNQVTFTCLLKACAVAGNLEQGRQVHACIKRTGFGSDIFVGSALVDMYAKCGSLEDARKAFDEMPERNVVSWSAMIAGYAQHGERNKAFLLFEQMLRGGVKPNRVTFTSILKAFADTGRAEEALLLFERMQWEGIRPDEVTLTCVLKACTSVGELKRVHAFIEKSGFNSDDVFLGSALVDTYGKCGSLEDARRVFDGLRHRNVVSWNAMIGAYTQPGCGKELEALALFERMRGEDIELNPVTFVSILKTCASLGNLEQGKRIHACIKKHGYNKLDAFVGSALVDMYAKCGSLEDARQVFDEACPRDVVLWNAMISAYIQHGYGKEALSLFGQMQREGAELDQVTFSSVLKACASVGDLENGKQVHACIKGSGFESDVFVGSTLVDMYAKCGSLEDARRVFDGMSERNVVSWSAIIAGYAQQGHAKQAVALLQQMQEEGVKPDEVTFTGILKACARQSALEQGKQAHACVKNNGFESNLFVGNTLVDMYAKCGSIGDARQVFDGLHQRNVVSWNAMIAAYAQHGYGKEALELFQKMQQEGVRPDKTTFVSVLSACSHEGLQSEAGHILDSMTQEHGITPVIEHYCCMVDVLCRLGRLAEAEELINKMPIQPTGVIWMTFLGACRIHGDMEIGRRALLSALESGSKDAAIKYIFFFCSREGDGEVTMRGAAGLLKKPMWIDLNGDDVHSVVPD